MLNSLRYKRRPKVKFLAAKAESEIKQDKAKTKATKAKQNTGETSNEEVCKARKDAHNAKVEAKKRKVIAEKAAAADEIRIKHTLAASQAELKAKIYREESEDRMAEANARKAEANARREEAKAIKAGNILKAKAKKSEAQAKKTEALSIKAKIDQIKIERKVEAKAEAKKKLSGPLPQVINFLKNAQEILKKNIYHSLDYSIKYERFFFRFLTTINVQIN